MKECRWKNDHVSFIWTDSELSGESFAPYCAVDMMVKAGVYKLNHATLPIFYPGLFYVITS